MGTDLFMSYIADDRRWAESLAWDLEAVGHRVKTDGGELAGGEDLACVLQRRQPEETTIAVLSPSYVTTLAQQPVAAEIVRTQATGDPCTLVAVQVRECTTDGSLSGVPILNLVGLDVATTRSLLEQLPPSPPVPARPPGIARRDVESDPVPKLEDVFMRSGTPRVTFVEPEDFDRLTLSLRQSSRAIVIEGPSGIGKTSVLSRALEHLAGNAAVRQRTVLNPLSEEDLQRLRAIQSWHRGTVAVDDFHRLEPELRDELGMYVKYLADARRDDLRIVLMGIPGTGRRLIQSSADLAGRVDVFALGRVRNGAVLTLIARGEEALNVSLAEKDALVLAASGSLHIAQILCYEVCRQAGIRERQPVHTEIPSNVNSAVAQALQDVDPKFRPLTAAFESVGGSDEDIGGKLLQELAHSPEGSLTPAQLRSARPDLAAGLRRFMRENYIEQVRSSYPEYERHILYDEQGPSLTLHDPQLAFYLKATFGVTRSRVFISYSHEDKQWLTRMLIHLKPSRDKGVIDVWDDTMILPGDDWKSKIKSALESASVAVLLVSADFLASDFIVQDELPPLLEGAETRGTRILPVIVGPCAFEETRSLSRYQAVNDDPRRSILAMAPWEREELFRKVARAVNDAVRRSSDR